MKKCRPKTRAIMRTRGVYSAASRIQQFKTHVWRDFHAYNSDLDKLDNLQNSFVRELNMTPESAFIDFNVASLHLIRDIGCLGAVVQGQPRHCTLEIVIAFLAGIAPRISQSSFAPKRSASIPNSRFLRWSPFRFDESIDVWDGACLRQITKTFGGSQPLPAVSGPMVTLFQRAVRVISSQLRKHTANSANSANSANPVPQQTQQISKLRHGKMHVPVCAC